MFRDCVFTDGGGIRVGYTGSLACVVSRGGWWLWVGSTGRGISSVLKMAVLGHTMGVCRGIGVVQREGV
jgi:hypothetical protein